MAFPSLWEVPPANLEIDKDFDPRQVRGAPELGVKRKAVRLRDAAGRRAVVEGAEVKIEAGQAVLRFQAQALPTDAAVVLRGVALDEAGKPIRGAKLTAAFASKGGAFVSPLEGMTDARGKFERKDVRLQQSFFSPDARIRMIVTKPGFAGVESKELSLFDVKKAGSADFGTLVLKPGHTLRGKVIDEKDHPVQGAVVTNMTNDFLYGPLRCRTDAAGRFAMPDLPFGDHKISAGYGEGGGQIDFAFGPESRECLLRVQLTPANGTRSPAAAAPRARPVPPPRREGAWDLTPPRKEPRYQHEPRYGLLVFGPQRAQRIWMVLDGTTLYVDRNGNADLTEAGERLEPNNPTDGSNRFGGSGSHTHFDVFEFTVQAGVSGVSKLRLDRWIRARDFTPKTDFDKKLQAKWLKLRYENATLWRQQGQGQGQTAVSVGVSQLGGIFVHKRAEERFAEKSTRLIRGAP